jgi:hypothetical protein
MTHPEEYIKLCIDVAEKGLEVKSSWHDYGVLAEKKIHGPDTPELREAREAAIATVQLWQERYEQALDLLARYKKEWKESASITG